MALAVMTASATSAVPAMPPIQFETFSMPAAPLEAPAPPYNATVNLHIDGPEGMIIDAVSMYSLGYPDIGKTPNPDTDISYEWRDDVVYFRVKARNFNDKKDYVLISPDITVKGVTDVTLDLNDCVNEIDFQSVLPDGTDARTDVHSWSYEENKFVKTETGNINDTGYMTAIQRRNAYWQSYEGLGISMFYYDYGNMQVRGCGGLMINDLSAEYEVLNCQTFTINDSNVKCVLIQSINGSDIRGQKTLRNNPENYFTVEADYTAPTPGPYDVTDADWYDLYVKFRHDGLWGQCMIGGEVSSFEGADKPRVCFNLCENHMIDPVMTIAKGVADNGGVGEYREFSWLSSPRMVFGSGGKAVFMPSHTDTFLNFLVINVPEDGVAGRIYHPFTVHDRFTYECDFSKGERPRFGNSTPILTLSMLWDPSYAGSCVEPYYTGRFGEDRECDLDMAFVTVRKNNEAVFTGSVREWCKWIANEMTQSSPSGKYEFSFENDNCLVDGMETLNTTVVTVDTRTGDLEPPTLTYLSFRDKEDKMTDRFENGEDGVLEFTAVDFSSNFNEQGFPYFTGNAPKNLTVEYSPFGADSFKPLEYEEVPELYFMPEFGHFYRAQLDRVNVASETGWFSLRFTITDEAGNSQVQTIEPAFRIEAAISGVAPVMSDRGIGFDGENVTADGEITIYDISGRVVRSGQDRVNVSGLSGIYMVKNGANVGKRVF